MIGVFDSGSGGLTILQDLAAALPERSFLYFGDHAHAPYGERRPEEIHHLTRDAVERLFECGCRLVILACNTASATSLRHLQRGWLAREYPDRRVLGVLVPMVEAITGIPWMAVPATSAASGRKKSIAVFATRRTVESGAYPLEVALRAPGMTVTQQACPRLVGLIEDSAPKGVLRACVAGYVAGMMERLQGNRPDAAILGCTHYPLVADLFAEALPEGVEILSQPALVAASLRSYLTRHPEIDLPAGKERTVRFLTTGAPAPASALAGAFLGHEAVFFPAAGASPLPHGAPPERRATADAP